VSKVRARNAAVKTPVPPRKNVRAWDLLNTASVR
jgi:hypothetical protein